MHSEQEAPKTPRVTPEMVDGGTLAPAVVVPSVEADDPANPVPRTPENWRDKEGELE
jgi:hypothetical protein